MRIAIIGTRGIPANYGGFETFVECLAPRLVERGHDVTVYCRSHHVSRDLGEFMGVKLVVLPTIRHKYLDTVVHAFLSAADAVRRRFDVVLFCNAATAPFIPLLTVTGTPVAINVDGLERKRRKWNRLGSLYYSLGERCSVWFATRVVTDAGVIEEYYRSRDGVSSTMIAYGGEVKREITPDAIAEFGVEPERYILYLSRLEPENNAAMVIEAFAKVRTDMKLLVVGDAPYADDYKKHLRELAAGDPRVIFTGFVFGEPRQAIQQNAYAYVHATEVGGTHPALIEAMGYGNCSLVYSTPENIEVAADHAISYSDANDLAENLQQLIDDPEVAREWGRRAQTHIAANYTWENVTDQYEALFEELTVQPHSGRESSRSR